MITKPVIAIYTVTLKLTLLYCQQANVASANPAGVLLNGFSGAFFNF